MVMVLSSPQRGGTIGSAFSGSSVVEAVELAHLAQEGLVALDADAERHAGRADVRGMDEHLRHRQDAVRGVIVADRELAVAQARARIEASS